MKFAELVLQMPEGSFVLPFHEQLTVVSGLDIEERRLLVSGMFTALTGDGDNDAELRVTDATGRVALLRATGGHLMSSYAEGGSFPSPVGSLAPDATTLRNQILLAPSTFSAATADHATDVPELAEARDRLEAIEDEIEQASEHRDRTRMLQNEAARLAHELRRADEIEARREFAVLLGRIEGVEAELSRSGDPQRAQADVRLIGEADRLLAAAERWNELVQAVAGHRNELGDAEMLADDLLRTVVGIPESPPVDVRRRVQVLRVAKAERDELRGQLDRLAAQALPEPSDPVVRELARHEQDELWLAHRRMLETRRHVSEVRFLVDGEESSDSRAASVIEMEEAHRRLVRAEDLAERRLVPGAIAIAAGGFCGLIAVAFAPPVGGAFLLAGAGAGWSLIVRPRRVMQAATEAEAAAAKSVGAASYLGFHLRRVEASLDRDLRQRLEVAELEHRIAAQTWTELTGGLDPVVIERFEEEVRGYRRAVDSLGSRADEMESVAADLERTTARVDQLTDELVVSCAEYGIADPPLDDADVLDRLFAHQCRLRVDAQLQAELAGAERELAAVETELTAALDQAGVPSGTVAERAGALPKAIASATTRHEARQQSRPRDEAERELAGLRREAKALEQPGFEQVTAADTDLPGAEDLASQLAVVEAELATLESRTVDVERLHDRREALIRRVNSLEASLDTTRRSVAPAVVEKIQELLQARFAGALASNDVNERLPIIADEALISVPAGRKWDLLDMLRRLSERNQVLYLTEDPFVTAWARSAAEQGTIRLLEAEAVDTDDALAEMADGAPERVATTS